MNWPFILHVALSIFATVTASGTSRSCLCNTHIAGKTIPCQGGICHVPPYNDMRRGSKQFACGTIQAHDEKKYFCIATDELDDEDNKCTYRPEKMTTFCVCRNKDFCNKETKTNVTQKNHSVVAATPGFWDRGYIKSSEEDAHSVYNAEQQRQDLRRQENEESRRKYIEEERRREKERIDRERYYEDARRQQQEREREQQRQKQEKEIEEQKRLLEEDARRRRLELEKRNSSIVSKIVVESPKTDSTGSWKPNKIDQFAPDTQEQMHLWIPEIEPASIFAESTAVTTSYRRVTQPDMLPIPTNMGEYYGRTDRIETSTSRRVKTTTTINLMPGEDAWWLVTQRTIKPWLPWLERFRWKDRQTTDKSTNVQTPGTTTYTTTPTTTTPTTTTPTTTTSTTTTSTTTTPTTTTSTTTTPTTTTSTSSERTPPNLFTRTGWEEKVIYTTTQRPTTRVIEQTPQSLFTANVEQSTATSERQPWWERTSARPTFHARNLADSTTIRRPFTEPNYADHPYSTTRPSTTTTTTRYAGHWYTRATTAEPARNAYRPTYEEDIKMEKPYRTIWTKSSMRLTSCQFSLLFSIFYFIVFR